MSDPTTGHSEAAPDTATAATSAPATASTAQPTQSTQPAQMSAPVQTPVASAPTPPPAASIAVTEVQTSSIDATNSWHNSIAHEYQSIAQKYNTPNDLAKAYSELNTRFSKPYEVPGQGASETDIAIYRKRMGIPDTADGYALATPEKLSALAGEGGADAITAQISQMAQKAHELGAPPAVAQGMLDYYAEIRSNELTQAQQQIAQNNERAMAALKAEWGSAYDENVAVAKRALRTFGGDVEAITNKNVNGKPLGDDPDFIRMMANFGRNMSESTPEMLMDSSAMSSMQERFDDLNQKYVMESDPILKQKISRELDEVSKKLFPG